MIKRSNSISVKRKLLVGLLVLVLLTSTGSFVGYARELTGPEIIERVYNSPTPETVNAILTMKLINNEGHEKIRVMEAWRKGKENKVVVVKKPENVAGMALLRTVSNDNEENRWLYLPSLNITKKMNQESQNRKFMGSDFTYDDLGSRNTDEYTYVLLRTKSSNGETIYVVEGEAQQPKKTGYSKIRSWISEKSWKPEKVEYYDLKGELLKVQKNSGLEKIENFWVVKKMIMENKQRGSKTILTWTEYEINTKLPEKIFNPEALSELIEEG